METTTIGLDIAGRVFRVHGAGASGRAGPRREEVPSPFEGPPAACLAGIEACGTAHRWAREPAESRAALPLRRTRDPPMRQRAAPVDAPRGHMAEFGVVAPRGIGRVGEPIAALMGEDEAGCRVGPAGAASPRGGAGGAGRTGG